MLLVATRLTWIFIEPPTRRRLILTTCSRTLTYKQPALTGGVAGCLCYLRLRWNGRHGGVGDKEKGIVGSWGLRVLGLFQEKMRPARNKEN